MNRQICRLLILTILPVPLWSQDTLLLFHPTRDNMETIRRLQELELLNLRGYHVLGVCHSSESYDYSRSEEWIRTGNRTQFSIRLIGKSIDRDKLYGENASTPEFRSLFENSRGAFFMGGPDIPPEFYGEPHHLLTRVSDYGRHRLELSFLFHLLGGSQNRRWKPWMDSDPGYVISGICLGMQTLAVATGGTLIQDIPTEVYRVWDTDSLIRMPADRVHRNYLPPLPPECPRPTSYHFHRIRIPEGSFLNEGASPGSCPSVLSSHHQAVENLGQSWIISATSMDEKIVEAIRHSRYRWVTGVQFHPEKPGLYDPSVIHAASCVDSIRFNRGIADSASRELHRQYWEGLGSVLQSRRK